MFSYLPRIVSVLPGDLCSLFFGSLLGGYRRYLIGSLLGLSPMMILHVLFADLFAQSLSGSFWEALTPQNHRSDCGAGGRFHHLLGHSK